MQPSSSALSSILTPRPPQLSVAWLQMCSARQAHIGAAINWLDEHPDPDLVAEEVTGSINAIRDIARLRGIGLK